MEVTQVLPKNLLPDLAMGSDQFSPRPIPVEEQFGRQNDRLGYLRSMGLPWAEAVFQLRDLLVGIEDQEFWDGIPASTRTQLAKSNPSQQEKIREEWAPEGWIALTFRAIPGPRGKPIYRPTPEELSHAYRVIMRLAARKGLTWKTKRISGIGWPTPPEDAGEAHEEALGTV